MKRKITIEKYQGNYVLGYDAQGKPWIKKKGGKWKPAVCIPK